MAKFDVVDLDRKKVSEIELSDAVFAAEQNENLLYEAAKMQQINRRRGTVAVKNTSLVSGGGKKPWKQKGTGRARQGSTRATQWVGGAASFGPLPRDYSYRMPASARKKALCVALSAKQREGKVIVLDRIEITSGKTKDMVKALAGLEVRSALIVVTTHDEKLHRASRNIPGLKLIEVEGVNVYDILGHEHVLLTQEALKALGERFPQ